MIRLASAGAHSLSADARDDDNEGTMTKVYKNAGEGPNVKLEAK
jgi:hypothetical protein